MKGLIKEGTRRMLSAVGRSGTRKHFGGKKKYAVTLDTQDHDEAVRRALVAARDFEARCGISDGPMFNLAAIAGLCSDGVVNRNEMVDIEGRFTHISPAFKTTITLWSGSSPAADPRSTNW